ncbi:MAG: hypothetical protein ACFUZC_02550 [Chthoniobacteraceae bacterium]
MVPTTLGTESALLGGILQNAQAIEEGFQVALTEVFKAPECSIGTQDLVSGLARESRKRLYKIKHRLG